MTSNAIVLTGLLLYCVACAPLPRAAPPVQTANVNEPSAARPRSSDTDALLAYYEANRDRTGEELRAEIALLQRRIASTPTSILKLQLAMLLGAPYNDTRDSGQALKLLDDVTKDSQLPNGSTRQLTTLLQSQLTLSARLEENVLNLSQRVKEERRRTEQIQTKQDSGTQQLEQKLKEEQRRSELAAAKHEDTVQQLTAKLREEQKRSEELQQKLDAIMKIEKSLIERQQPKEPNRQQ